MPPCRVLEFVAINRRIEYVVAGGCEELFVTPLPPVKELSGVAFERGRGDTKSRNENMFVGCR